MEPYRQNVLMLNSIAHCSCLVYDLIKSLSPFDARRSEKGLKE